MRAGEEKGWIMRAEARRESRVCSVKLARREWDDDSLCWADQYRTVWGINGISGSTFAAQFSR